MPGFLVQPMHGRRRQKTFLIQLLVKANSNQLNFHINLYYFVKYLVM